MLGVSEKKELYQALLDRNAQYDRLFWVGVKTTGVFCHPTCSARKPKFGNCDFFLTVQAALLASFRPCKRCRPLSHPQQVSTFVQTFVEAIEGNPERRWKRRDLQALSAEISTACRQFKLRFGITLIQYARARRLGLAMKQIRSGKRVPVDQPSTDYEAGKGFEDSFSSIMGSTAISLNHNTLKAAWIDTKLGPMLAIANEEGLCLLEFIDRRGLEREIERLRIRTRSAICSGWTDPIKTIESELKRYFEGDLREFNVPLALIGSPFQQLVWKKLQAIPYGETPSYAEIAKSIDRPSAVRAVARANGANQLAIVIPCHRVISTNGDLGGYGGGLPRKEWLIQHEKRARNDI